MNCAFCEVPEIKDRVIVENGLAMAFPTKTPIVPGHVLITPKRCVESFEEMTIDEMKSIYELSAVLKKSLEKVFGAEGFNFAWNEGSSSGQTVPHFHLHILPRKNGDSGITEYEPRKFLYRPGSREDTPEEELREVSSLIKQNIL